MTKKKNILQLDWSLYPKQLLALSDTHNSCLYGGAAGGGKSHLNKRAASMWGFMCPGIQIYLFRKNLQDLEKNYISGSEGFPAILRDFINHKLVKIDLNKKKIMFKNGGPKRNSYAGGSIIHLCHLAKESDLISYEGQEIHALIMDEVCDFNQKEFEFLRSRMRLGGWNPPPNTQFSKPGYFPRILLTTNPGGRGHSFFKNGWVDLASPYEVTQMDEEQGGMRRIFIPSLVTDNTILMENDPSYVSKLKAISDPLRKAAVLYGSWDITEGGVLEGSWRHDDNVIDDFEIPKNWRIHRGFDWGSAKPFAAVYFAESNGEEVILSNGKPFSFPRGTLFIIKELYGCVPGQQDMGLKISDVEIGKRMKVFEDAYLSDYTIIPGASDGTIWSKSNKDKAIIDDIHLGYFGRKIYDPYALLVPADRSKGSRIRGYALMRSMLANAHGRVEKGRIEKPGLIVFKSCKNVINIVPHLPRDKNNPEDSCPKSEDHLSDVIRYRLLFNRQPVKTIKASVF